MTTYQYDSKGRISKVIDARNNATNIQYEHYGNVASVVDKGKLQIDRLRKPELLSWVPLSHYKSFLPGSPPKGLRKPPIS